MDLEYFISGLLTKGKTSLSSLVGMGSSIQVDDLDDDVIMKVNWMESFQTHIKTNSLYNSCC